MITFSTTGVQNYSVVALNEAYGTPIGIANTALTANLMLSCVRRARGRAACGAHRPARVDRGRLVPRHRADRAP
jgi:hypothetical protein